MEQFESIKKTISPDDITYWVARELSHELSISYDQFLPYITGAIANCKNNGYDSSFHFTQIDDDYQLSQYACYILIEKLTIADADYHRKIKNYFYTKDFQGRNNEKQKVHEGSYESKTGNPKYTNEREIRNTKRGVNVGAETDGKGKYLRPVLILKNIGSLCLAVPLTKQGKEGDHPSARFYHKLTSVAFCDSKKIPYDSFVMLTQIKIIDKKRCIENKKTIDPEEFKQIKNLLRDMYFPEDF